MVSRLSIWWRQLFAAGVLATIFGLINLSPAMAAWTTWQSVTGGPSVGAKTMSGDLSGNQYVNYGNDTQVASYGSFSDYGTQAGATITDFFQVSYYGPYATTNNQGAYYDGGAGWWMALGQPTIGGVADKDLTSGTGDNATGNLWFTTADGYVSMLDGATNTVWTNAGGKVDTTLTGIIFEAHFNQPMVVGPNGVYLWNGSTWQNVGATLASLHPEVITEDSNDNIYVGTQLGGVYKAVASTVQTSGFSQLGTTDPSSGAGETSITAAMQSNHSVVAVDTGTNGVWVYNAGGLGVWANAATASQSGPVSFNLSPQVSGVTAPALDVATANGTGFFESAIQSPPPTPTISSVTPTGTYPNSLIQITGTNYGATAGTVTLSPSPSPGTVTVSSWANTSIGVQLSNVPTGTYTLTVTNSNGSGSTSLTVGTPTPDSYWTSIGSPGTTVSAGVYDGTSYYAVIGGNLAIQNGGSWQTITGPASGSTITSICDGPSGTLYVGTNNANGVYQYNPSNSQWTGFGAPNGDIDVTGVAYAVGSPANGPAAVTWAGDAAYWNGTGWTELTPPSGVNLTGIAWANVPHASSGAIYGPPQLDVWGPSGLWEYEPYNGPDTSFPPNSNSYWVSITSTGVNSFTYDPTLQLWYFGMANGQVWEENPAYGGIGDMNAYSSYSLPGEPVLNVTAIPGVAVIADTGAGGVWWEPMTPSGGTYKGGSTAGPWVQMDSGAQGDMSGSLAVSPNKLVVDATAGGVYSYNEWAVTPPPSVTSVSGPVLMGATTVTINGSNFGSAPGSVSIGGYPATYYPIVSWSDSAITLNPAELPDGTYTVTVTASGATTPATGTLVIQPAPTVLSVEAAPGGILIPGDMMLPPGQTAVINGTGFGSQTGTVALGVYSLTPSSWGDLSGIGITIPDNPSWANTTQTLTVTDTDGQSTNFPVVIAPLLPQITGIAGGVGGLYSNETMVINGVYLGSNPGTVNVGGVGITATPATVVSWSDTSVTVQMPFVDPGPSSLVLATGGQGPDNIVAYASYSFTEPDPPNPILSGVDSASRNWPMTISGYGFGTNTGDVVINGVYATPSSWNDTSITVTVPNLVKLGSNTLTVITAAGGSGSIPINVTSWKNIGFAGSSSPNRVAIDSRGGIYAVDATTGFNALYTYNIPNQPQFPGSGLPQAIITKGHQVYEAYLWSTGNPDLEVGTFNTDTMSGSVLGAYGIRSWGLEEYTPATPTNMDVDANNDVLVATSGPVGVLVYSNQNGTWQNYAGSQISVNNVWTMEADPAGPLNWAVFNPTNGNHLLLATVANGVYDYDIGTGQYTSMGDPLGDSDVASVVYATYGNDSMLLASVPGGLAEWQPGSGTWASLGGLGGTPVGVVADNSGNIFAAFGNVVGEYTGGVWTNLGPTNYSQPIDDMALDPTTDTLVLDGAVEAYNMSTVNQPAGLNMSMAQSGSNSPAGSTTQGDTLSIHVTNLQGAAEQGATVSFSASGGTLSAATVVTDANGNAQVTVYSSGGTLVTVTGTATLNGYQANASATLNYSQAASSGGGSTPPAGGRIPTPPVLPTPTLAPSPAFGGISLVGAGVGIWDIGTIDNPRWYTNDIIQAVTLGIVSGDPQGYFHPDAPVTRAEFAKMVAEAVDHGVVPGDQSAGAFSDVPGTVWYSVYVDSMAGDGIIQGFPDGSFQPDGSLTRAQAAALVYRAELDMGANMASVGQTPTAFSDETQIGDWAKKAVTALSRLNIVNGMPGGAFEPEGQVTKAQAAVMLVRLMNQLGYK